MWGEFKGASMKQSGGCGGGLKGLSKEAVCTNFSEGPLKRVLGKGNVLAVMGGKGVVL